MKLEALAIWWSVTHKFRSYIEGQQFFLETDHKPLISLMKKPYHNTRIERWMTTLQQYDIVIRHIPGKDNLIADALSRYPVEKPDSFAADEPRFTTSSTQTDVINVNVVTTRSKSRNHQSSNSSEPVPPLPVSSPIKTSLIPRSSASPDPSSYSFTNNVPLFFDDVILNQHQNQDSSIHRIKTTFSIKF